jgi:hypothetical protein
MNRWLQTAAITRLLAYSVSRGIGGVDAWIHVEKGRARDRKGRPEYRNGRSTDSPAPASRWHEAVPARQAQG